MIQPDGLPALHPMKSTQSKPEEDPEKTAIKYMAFRSAQRREQLKALFITWILALPIAWVAWQSIAPDVVLSWVSGGEPLGETLQTMTTFVTVGWAWLGTVLLLSPVRWHLRSKWEVEPEAFGLASGGSTEPKQDDQADRT